MRLLLALAALLLPVAVQAQTLRIGMAAETDSADPHHYAFTPDNTLRLQIFESLVTDDGAGHFIPALASKWERTDLLTWRFTLNTARRFSNGAAFGAQDVIATFCRVLNNREEVAGSYSSTLRRMTSVTADDNGTVTIHTRDPEPLLLSDLAGIAMLPRSLMPPDLVFNAGTSCGGGAGYPAVTAFNDGSAAIGTGPYRLRHYEHGAPIVLDRNPNWPGPAQPWAEVRLTPITQTGSRVAALLAGDQDVIEAPGTADVTKLRTDKRVQIVATPTNRLIFWQLDVARDPSPFVTGPNALKDVRVRQALSLALNREAIVSRIMDGLATPAAQFLPGDQTGTIPGLKPLPYDAAKARALLEEAGYKQGFALTLHASNNRYVNDAAIAQAVAQQWQRVGVRAAVETLPGVTFFPARAKRAYSVAMGGWTTDAGETLAFFRTWLMTTDLPRGLGPSNNGGWADAPFDALVQKAIATQDTAPRAALLQEAGKRALAEMPVIPLHFESAVWATRTGLRFAGRPDQTTRAADISPAP